MPMMKAAVVTAFGKPLEMREVPVPSPAAGQILVKTVACGVCHTDVHAADGDWPVKPVPPFIPGHEGCGFVSAVGSGVQYVKEGDRVGVPWLYSTCGRCEWCLTGWETVCPDAQYCGYSVNGAFAEYLLADPNYVAHIPKGLEFAPAAPVICAGVTVYKGIKETGALAGQWMLISGLGGLGHMAIQYAKAMGFHVAGVDIEEEKLRLARQLGADVTVNGKDPDAIEQLRKATGGGAHGVVITAPSLKAFRQCIDMTRRRGAAVLIGLPPGEFPVPLFDMVLKHITIRGSLVGTRQDLAEALEFAAEGLVKAHYETQPLEAINTVVERLKQGHVDGRVVLDLTASEIKAPVTQSAFHAVAVV